MSDNNGNDPVQDIINLYKIDPDSPEFAKNWTEFEKRLAQRSADIIKEQEAMEAANKAAGIGTPSSEIESLQEAITQARGDDRLTLSFFQQAFASVWTGFTELLKDLLIKVQKWLLEEALGINDESWQRFLDIMEKVGFIDGQGAEALTSLRDMFPNFKALGQIALSVTAIKGYMGVLMGTMGGKLGQKLNKEYSPNAPDPGSVLRAAFVAPEKGAEVRDVFARAGLSEEDSDLMLLANYATYPMEVVRTLYLRKVLSTEKMKDRMSELGFTPERINEVVQSWDIIPGPQDILWMVAKEAFEEDAVQMLGLDDEFPGAQSEWLEKQGLNRDWQIRYWRAHWDQPSIGQMFEMLHRGVINDAELEIGFKTQEIPTFWRDKLTAIAYNPYTRVDTRRMYDLGILGVEEIYISYRDQGYDHEKATNMTLFTVAYAENKEKELTRGQIETGYRERILDWDTAWGMLVEIGYTSATAEYLLAYVDYQEDQDYRAELQENIKQGFLGNLIDGNEARTRLTELGVDPTRIRILMERWELTRIQNTKLPSKTDLDKFMKAGVIRPEEYVNEMIKLGYSDKYISWYVELLAQST